MIKIKFTILFIGIFLFTKAHTQVTIGSTEKPVKGAILQLKSIPNVNDGSANATKGLGLPRVHLLGVNTLNPISTDDNKQSYIGMVVYNTNTMCASLTWNNSDYYLFESGFNVWNGEYWDKIPRVSLSPKIGRVKDGEGNSYTTMDYGNAGVWMIENLRSRVYDTNAVVSPLIKNQFESSAPGLVEYTTTSKKPAWAYPGKPLEDNNGDNPAYFNLDHSIGLLYNTVAIFGSDTYPFVAGTLSGGDVQGLCPNGWIVPTFQDYQELYNEINANPTKYASSSSSMVENLMSSCNTIGIPAPILERGQSLPTYQGGFSLKLYATLAFVSNVSTMVGFDFGLDENGNPRPISGSSFPALYVRGESSLRDPSSKRQGLVFVDYGRYNPIVPHGTDFWNGFFSREDTMAPVRCKKKD